VGRLHVLCGRPGAGRYRWPGLDLGQDFPDAVRPGRAGRRLGDEGAERRDRLLPPARLPVAQGKIEAGTDVLRIVVERTLEGSACIGTNRSLVGADQRLAEIAFGPDVAAGEAKDVAEGGHRLVVAAHP